MSWDDDSLRAVSSLKEKGRQCIETMDHAEALVHFTKALTLLKKPEQARVRAEVLNNIGHVKHTMGRWEEALTNFREAALLYEALSDWAAFGRQLANIGSVLREQGDYINAAAMYEQALTAFSRAGDAVARADQFGNLGYTHAMADNPGKARHCFVEAIEIYEKIMDKAKAEIARWNLAALG